MSMQTLVRLAGAAVLTAALCAPAAAQDLASFTGLYVFGDSLSDSGNNNLQFGGLTGPAPTSGTFVPSLPYAASPPGAYRPTYSNGPTWVTSFAAGLGLSAFSQPSLIGGGNYAYGGARMFTDGASPAPLPPNFPASVQTQLNGYLASATVSPTALYVIAGGGNDVRDVGTAVAGGAPLGPTTAAAAAAYATSAAQMVFNLRAAGATNIIVWNVPDVGKTPSAGSGVGPAAAAASFIAGAFNSALAQALAGSGATIFDVYGLIDNVVANPASYGMTNVTQACGFAGNGCNAATALFWDGIHPTAYAQGIVANAMLAAVPEPASVLMLSAGALLVLARSRRRRA
jgi:outer membrane lipase/esterase